MEAAQVSISRWVDKTTMDIYTVEFYMAIKRKKNLPFVAAWGDLENMLQVKRKTNTIWFHSYVESIEQTEQTSKIDS